MAKHAKVAKRAAPDTFEMTPEADDPRGPGMAGPRTISEALAQFELPPTEKQPARASAPPDLSISAERLGAIDAGRARQTQLQQYLEERRGIFENAGATLDLIGIEFFQIRHKSCGKDWLVPVEQGLPSSDCPFCRRA